LRRKAKEHMKMDTDNLVLDRANFPMLWVESLNAYIHLLPITKIQYEYYLWDAPNPGLDQEWYDQVTKENKRISPHEITKDNYWQLFISAVLPDEAQHFAEWCEAQSGDVTYSLPTASQWQMAYRSFKEVREGDPFLAALELAGLAPRCRTILEKLAKLPSPASLAERLLFLGGLMEWVVGTEKPWGLFGYPTARFVAFGQHPDNGKPFYPTDLQARHKGYGFRLLRTKVA
jgi:hypothetical protein